MIKIGTSQKITLGYVFVIAILGLAVWLVYDNTRTFTKLDEAENSFMERRDLADSLIYSVLEMNNNERAVYLGQNDEWEDFDRSVRNTAILADSLKALITQKKQRDKIDTLITLLSLKRENALMIMEEMAENSSDAFFRQKVTNLKEGQDSVVIHPKGVEIKEDKEIVYDIVKTKKSFFARLADAFRGQHTDTLSIRHQSRKTTGDSVKHSIDIADTVADVLAKIKQEEAKARKAKQKSLAIKEHTQQVVGIKLARRIEQLIEDIKKDELFSLQTAIKADLDARRNIMIKIISLAMLAVFSAMILLFFVLRDIKRAKIYRENLEHAKAETERIMAQRERLLLTITHDIKAPAASISGFIELLEGYSAEPQAASYLKNIKSSATHLLNLVSALLDYHQLESGKAEVRNISFSARQLVEGCAEGMRPLAEAQGLALKYDVSGCTEDLLKGDAFRIKQILNNLVSNAIKYTQKGEVAVKAATQNGYLMIEVSDTGCGMSKDETKKIFNAFTRLPESQGIEGVGLGLSITRELVNLLQGRITVSSVKGKGTTFRVSIPARKTDKEMKDKEQGQTKAALPTPSLNSNKILIIDDDPLQLQLLKEMLTRISHGSATITTSRKAEEALRKLAEERPSVFFIDIEMPEINGVELIKRIPSREGMTLIAMTAHEPSIEPRLIEAGFNACLFKPFNTERLAETLATVTGLSVYREKEHNKQKPTNRFNALTEFAAGDEDAEREILSSFRSELETHISTFRDGSSSKDRNAISHAAHKALPMMEMVKAGISEQLKALSPEHINEVDDAELRTLCEEVTSVMESIKAEIDAK